MKAAIFSMAAACALVSPASAQPPADREAPAHAPSAASVQKASPAMVARMQALREAYVARTAVYDRAEQAFRAPTEAERAALSASPARATESNGLELARGGVAVRGASGELSFLVAQVGPDGAPIVRHADEAPQRPAFARPLQLPLAVKAATQPAREVRHAE